MDHVFELHKTMTKNELILVYEGDFSQVVTRSVLAMAEENLEQIEERLLIKRRVFNIIIECLQNISKYAEYAKNDLEGVHSGIFVIGRLAQGYVVSSGNYMLTKNVDSLKDRLSSINSLSDKELKDLYRDTLKNMDSLSPQGGAGLGFIDMARKSGGKLAYQFHRIDEKYSFFTLKTTVSDIVENRSTK